MTKSLNTRITANDVRAELADLSFFEVLDYMRERAWSLVLDYEYGVAFVTFKTTSWTNNLEYEFGYVCKTVSEGEVLVALKRAAELCLRVTEIFQGTYPMEHVDDTGVISEDLEMLAMESEGVSAMLRFSYERYSSNRIDPNKGVKINHKKFAKLTWDGASHLYTPRTLHRLEDLLTLAQKELT
jgi:hypothetical protein